MIQLINKYIKNLINKDLNIFQEQVFIYLESGNEFIYKNLSNLEVSRLSQSLYKNIVTSKRKIVNRGEYYHELRMPDGDLGYAVLDKSVRLFRMPNIFAKLSDCRLKEDFQLNSNLNLNEYHNNLLKVQYCFYKEDSLFLIINKIGKNSLGLVVKPSDIYFLNSEFENIQINIEEGQKLFKNSHFEGEYIVKDTKYNAMLLSYLENTNNYRVRYKGKNLWVQLREKDINQEHTFTELFKKLETDSSYLENIDNIISIKNKVQEIKNIEKKNKEFKNLVYKNLLIEEDIKSFIPLKEKGELN